MFGAMRSTLDFIRLTRPVNLGIIAFTMYAMRFGVMKSIYLKHGVPNGFELSEAHFAISVLVMIFLAAAGNMINDYFDLKVDRVNKPERIIVGRTVKRRVVMAGHHAFNISATLLTVYLAYAHQVWWIVLFPITMAALLWFYSLTFQKRIWIGNFVVALLVSVVPIWAGILETSKAESTFTLLGGDGLSLSQDIWIWLFSFAGFAFWTTLIREVQKDMEDVEGDKAEGFKTIPIVWGRASTRKYLSLLFSILFVACAVGLYQIQNELTPKGSYIILLVASVIGIGFPGVLSWVLSHRAKKKEHYSRSSRWTKLTMAGGILIGALMPYWF